MSVAQIKCVPWECEDDPTAASAVGATSCRLRFGNQHDGQPCVRPDGDAEAVNSHSKPRMVTLGHGDDDTVDDTQANSELV